MSNLRDTVGLCIPYGRANSQYETEFEPATATVWGYFNPNQDAPCFSLGLLKDIASHDEAFARDGGRVEIEGRSYQANHYVLASRTPRVFNIGGDLALFSMLIKSQRPPRDRQLREAVHRQHVPPHPEFPLAHPDDHFAGAR